MRHEIILTTILALGLAGTVAAANDELPPGHGSRAEIWLGISSWPALGDIQPAGGGGFDSSGFGLGGAYHVPVKRFENSDLMVGVDGFIAATDSNLSGFVGDVAARHLYLGVSAKWALGVHRNVFLDAGFGYHEADMAELSDYAFGLEHEVWSSSTGAAFVGASWDIGAGREGHDGGFSLGLKVHFVDFGNVHDEDPLFVTLLGPDAGVLDSPVYMLQLGWAGR